MRGKFILTLVWAIGLTSCFVHSGGVGAGGGHACAVEARRRGVADLHPPREVLLAARNSKRFQTS